MGTQQSRVGLSVNNEAALRATVFRPTLSRVISSHFSPSLSPPPPSLQPSCRRATLFNYTGDQRASTQVATAPADAFNAHRMRSSASSRAFSRSLVNDAPTNSTDTLPLSLSVYVYTARSSPRAFRRLRSFVYRVSV